MGRATQAYNALGAAANKGSQTVVVSAQKLKNISNTSRLLGGNLQGVANAFVSVGGAAARMGSIVSRAGVAASNLGRALGFAALAAAPLALAMRNGLKDAAAFEDAMKGVEAVTPGQTEGLSSVEAEIRRLGRTTKFNAVEVAGAFEDMRKAGVEMQDTIKLGAPVTDLAAAGNVKIGESAELTIKIIKALGKDLSEAQNVVDKMAVAARLFTGDIVDIGNALTFTSGTARTLGIPLEQVTSAIGAIGEVTKEGSRAGTSLNAMLESMAAKSEKGKLSIGGMTVAIRKNAAGGMDLLNTVNDINVALEKKFKNPMDRVAAVAKTFTSRGARAFNALSQQMQKFDQATVESLTNFEGAARAMAETRMDSMIGQLTILKNTIMDLNIGFFGRLLQDLTVPVRSLARFIGDVSTAMEAMTLPASDTSEAAARIRSDFEKVGPTARAFAKGLLDAVGKIKETISGAITWVANLGKRFGQTFGPDKVAMIVSIASRVGLLVAVLAPVAAVLSVLMIAFGSFLSSMGAMIAGFAILKVLGPALLGGMLIPFVKVLLVIAAVAGLAVLAFNAFRREGESVGEGLSRLWNDHIVPFGQGFMQVFGVAMGIVGRIFAGIAQAIGEAIAYMTDAFTPLTNAIFGSSQGFTEFGQVVGFVVGTLGIAVSIIAGAVTELVVLLIKGLSLVTKFLLNNVVKVVKLLTFNVSEAVDGIRMIFDGDILAGLLRFGTALFSTLISPFSQFIRLLFDAAEAVLKIKIPPGIRRLVEAPEFTIPEPNAPKAVAAKKGQENETGLGDIVGDITDALANRKDEINLKTCLHLDGREIRESTAKFEKELGQRAAAKATPWQRRMQAEQASVAVK